MTHVDRPDAREHRRHALVAATGQEHPNRPREHEEHAIGVAEPAAHLVGHGLGAGGHVEPDEGVARLRAVDRLEEGLRVAQPRGDRSVGGAGRLPAAVLLDDLVSRVVAAEPEQHLLERLEVGLDDDRGATEYWPRISASAFWVNTIARAPTAIAASMMSKSVL